MTQPSKKRKQVRIEKKLKYIDGDGVEYNLENVIVIELGKQPLVDLLEQAIELHLTLNKEGE